MDQVSVKEEWQQKVINKHVSASILNTELSCIVVLNASFQASQIDHLKDLEWLDLDKCVEEATPYRKNSKQRLVILLICELLHTLSGKMMMRGVKAIAEIFAMKNIYTNTDIVTVFADQGSTKASRDSLVRYLKIDRLAAVLHGTALELSCKGTKLQRRGYTLITGGARGIGKMVAIKLAQLGRKLIITSRNISNKVKQFVQQLKTQFGVEVIALPLDLQSEKSCEELANSIESMKIYLSAVVHNGAVGTKTCLEQSKLTPGQTLIDINTAGPIILHQKLLQNGLFAKNCRISVVSSVGAVRGFREFNCVDVACKCMLEPWIEQLIQEGWDVHVIYPGATDTDMFRESTTNSLKKAKLYDEFSGRLPKGFVIPPELIASAICLGQELLSSDKSHTNRLIANCGMFLDFTPLPHVEVPQQAKQTKEVQELNEKRQAKPLSLPQAYYQYLQNPFNSETNPDGIINFGVSVNDLIQTKTLQYLPQFLKKQDCYYSDTDGGLLLHKIIAQATNTFKQNQTICACNVEALIHIIAQYYKNIYCHKNFEAGAEGMTNVRKVGIQEAQCAFVTEQDYQDVLDLHREIPLVVLLSSSQGLPEIALNQKIIVLYEFEYFPGCTVGVAHCLQTLIISQFKPMTYFFPVSTLVKSAIENGIDSVPVDDGYGQLQNAFSLLVQYDSHIAVDTALTFFGNGAIQIILTLGNSVFREKDCVHIDKPCYPGFIEDLDHIKIGFKYENLFDSLTQLQKVKRAENAGSKGYIICNPHNPVGCLISQKQVDELCEWALNHPNFHLIFDEMYKNSTRKGKISGTAIGYAQRAENIHVIRGFAKDFGICGFKVGVGITGNKEVLRKARNWRKMIAPTPYVLQTVAQMLQKSKYGRDILQITHQTIDVALQYSQRCLRQFNINFHQPDAGCFITLNLNNYFSQKLGLSSEFQLTQQEQIKLWCGLFHNEKICISMGYNFMCAGFARICSVTGENTIKEGIRRLNSGLQKFQQELKSKHNK